MKYEAPQMTALTSAINAIQSTQDKGIPNCVDTYDQGNPLKEAVCGYTDWE
jgi:hypothetical protein